VGSVCTADLYEILRWASAPARRENRRAVRACHIEPPSMGGRTELAPIDAEHRATIIT
jgi:hypothetical protein